MNNLLTLDDIAEFCWGFGCEFFLETSRGNFVWSDPDYNGDNTIRRFDGTYKDWCKKSGIPFARDKGRHVIRDYCGADVAFI